MYVTDEKWAEIVTAAQDKIADWNVRASKHGCSDIFKCEQYPEVKYHLLVTRHETKYSPDRLHVVARENETGEVRRAKAVRKGRVAGFKVWKSDPKAWKTLATKPAGEIVNKLKLADFIMIHSSHVTSVESTKQSAI